MPDEILRLTQREFYLLMDAKEDKIYDRIEFMSVQAILTASAINTTKKNLKAQDLFKRPKKGQQQSAKDAKQRIQRNQEFLNSLNFGKGVGHG